MLVGIKSSGTHLSISITYSRAVFTRSESIYSPLGVHGEAEPRVDGGEWRGSGRGRGGKGLREGGGHGTLAMLYGKANVVFRVTHRGCDGE